MQAFRHFLGRAAIAGALVGTSFLITPATAYAADSATGMQLPIIELEAKSSTATTSTVAPTTTSTTAPSANANSNVTIMTIPTANVSGDEPRAATTTTRAPSTSVVNTQLIGDSTNEPTSSGALASTGMNTTRFIGIAMLLTAIGLALLAFTDTFGRTERFVRSLLPNRISGK